MEINTMEEAALAYRKIEEKLEAEQAAFEAKTAKHKQAMEQLTVVMTAMLNRAGVASMNIPGVAEIKLVPKRTFGCSDWDTFMTWLVEQNMPELLQKRIHEANMQHVVDTHGGGNFLPPGVNVYTVNTLKVLKGK